MNLEQLRELYNNGRDELSRDTLYELIDLLLEEQEQLISEINELGELVE